MKNANGTTFEVTTSLNAADNFTYASKRNLIQWKHKIETNIYVTQNILSVFLRLVCQADFEAIKCGLYDQFDQTVLFAESNFWIS